MPVSNRPRATARRVLRAKLIFNAKSGRPEESSQQLADILAEMQSRQIWPEVFTVHPDSRVEAVVRSAIKAGIKLIVVAGGDGTVDSVAGAMVGSSATLGIIPTGTRNNLAFNLGIPTQIADAVALLRDGRRLRIDAGRIQSGRAGRWFLEGAALGLLTDLYSAADNIQHGNLAQVGEFLSTLVSATPSHLRMILDGRKRLDTTAHMVLVANMPVLGPRIQISQHVSFKDSRLDVFVFSDMSKPNLISYILQSIGGAVPDVGIKHYRVKHLKIFSAPQMPVMADGLLLGHGPVTALIHPRALRVMAGTALTGTPVTSPVVVRQGVSSG